MVYPYILQACRICYLKGVQAKIRCISGYRFRSSAAVDERTVGCYIVQNIGHHVVAVIIGTLKVIGRPNPESSGDLFHPRRAERIPVGCREWNFVDHDNLGQEDLINSQIIFIARPAELDVVNAGIKRGVAQILILPFHRCSSPVRAPLNGKIFRANSFVKIFLSQLKRKVVPVAVIVFVDLVLFKIRGVQTADLFLLANLGVKVKIVLARSDSGVIGILLACALRVCKPAEEILVAGKGNLRQILQSSAVRNLFSGYFLPLHNKVHRDRPRQDFGVNSDILFGHPRSGKIHRLRQRLIVIPWAQLWALGHPAPKYQIQIGLKDHGICEIAGRGHRNLSSRIPVRYGNAIV